MLDLSNPLVKVLLPVVGIAAVYLIATKKLNYSLKKDLLLVAPPIKSLLLWIFLYLIFMLGTDMLFHWRGPWNFQPWKEQTLFISVARVLAVGILGPVAEEMIFRGLLLTRLNRSKVNKWLSLIIIAAVWSAIHVDYPIGILLLLFFDGILLGLSLYTSRSLVTPIILHMIWNLYAIW